MHTCDDCEWLPDYICSLNTRCKKKWYVMSVNVITDLFENTWHENCGGCMGFQPHKEKGGE